MTAKTTALLVVIKFLTSGLFLVLDILASDFVSYSMFSAFALAMHDAVPVVRKKSVRGLRLGVAVARGPSISGTGYRE
jgi:hypothetical protein